MGKNTFLVLALLLSACFSQAQSGREMRFEVTFNDTPIQLQQSYYCDAIKDSVSFKKIQFYVSDVWLTSRYDTVYAPISAPVLIDLSKPETLVLPQQQSTSFPFSHIRFKMGIDSATNRAGVMGGDLDPTKGMYWTWQSGYINVKIEGNSPVCTTRKHAFQYHLGGYSGANNALQETTLALPENGPIVIRLALDEWLQGMSLEAHPTIMSPGETAVEASKKFKASISIQQ